MEGRPVVHCQTAVQLIERRNKGGGRPDKSETGSFVPKCRADQNREHLARFIQRVNWVHKQMDEERENGEREQHS
jgi:hypothetical protein